MHNPPQLRFTNLPQRCPSTLALQAHPPSDGEQSPTLPLGSHSHGLLRHVTVRVVCTEQAGQVRLMGGIPLAFFLNFYDKGR